MLRCGDTFLLPKAADAVEHLWIVLTEPDPQTGKAVCVNITKRYPHSETTVILHPGDHPFLKEAESVVYYSDADILDLNLIEKVLDAKTDKFVAKRHKPCTGQLLKQIQQGLLKSKFVKNRVKEYCKVAWRIKT